MLQFWYDLLTSPTILISALLIGSLGEIVKRSMNSKQIEIDVVRYRDSVKFEGPIPALWKRVFYYSLPAHPVLAGVAIGFIPWAPTAEALTKEGFELASRIATYSLAGIFCKVGYDTIISTGKRMIRTKAKELTGTTSSTPPPAPEPEPTEDTSDKP